MTPNSSLKIVVLSFLVVVLLSDTRYSVLAAELATDTPVLIASGKDTHAPMEPQIAIDEQGEVHVTYGVGNRVLVCRSQDRGRSFDAAVEVATVPNLSLGLRRGPRIVASADTLAVSLIAGEQGKGRDGDLLVWYSTNRGVSWKGPSMVNSVTGSAREGLHGMAIDSKGVIGCTWLDLRNNKSEVYVSQSNDGGKKWSENKAAYVSPERNVCECCHPSIAVNGRSIAVMFRNSLKGNRDMYVALSNEENSFASAYRLDAESWKLNACPMDGGMIALGDQNQFDAVWMRSGSVYRYDSRNSQEVLVGKGHQPWIAVQGEHRLIAWTTGKRGDLNLIGGVYREKYTLSGDCCNPCVAIGGGLKKPLAVACWQSKTDGQFNIHAMIIPL